MNKHLPPFTTILFVLLSAGCATIIHGSKQEVSMSSNPSQAQIMIDGIPRGSSPLVISLARNKTRLLKVSLEGYLPYETSFTRKTDAWIAGNIIFGGLIGLAIDAATGAMYKLTPDQLNAELKKSTASLFPKNGDLSCMIVLRADPDWQKIGQLTR